MSDFTATASPFFAPGGYAMGMHLMRGIGPRGVYGNPVLREMLRRRGGDLSGCQQQQLAIGRALVMRPRLLILDEPTEGIQPAIINDIGRAIETLRQGGEIAIVLVEQFFEFAWELADRVAVLERGSVVLSGTRAETDRSEAARLVSV